MFCFSRFKENTSLFSYTYYDLEQFGTIYFCKQNWIIYLFLSSGFLQNSETISEYSYFLGNRVICVRLVRICSPYNRTQLETLIILSKLWLECHIWQRCIDSDMTRQLWETKVDFTESIKLLRKTAFRAHSSLTRWVRKVTSWQAQDTEDILGTSWREEFTQICAYCRQRLMVNVWLCFLALRGYWKYNLRFLIRSSSKADLKQPIWSIAILTVLM